MWLVPVVPLRRVIWYIGFAESSDADCFLNDFRDFFLVVIRVVDIMCV